MTTKEVANEIEEVAQLGSPTTPSSSPLIPKKSELSCTSNVPNLLTRREQSCRPSLLPKSNNRATTPLVFNRPRSSINRPNALPTYSTVSFRNAHKFSSFKSNFNSNDPFAPLQQYNNALHNQYRSLFISNSLNRPSSAYSLPIRGQELQQVDNNGTNDFTSTVVPHDPYLQPMSVSDTLQSLNSMSSSNTLPVAESLVNEVQKENFSPITISKSIPAKYKDDSNLIPAHKETSTTPIATNNIIMNAFLRRQTARFDERPLSALATSSGTFRRPTSGNRVRLTVERPSSASPNARVVELSNSARSSSVFDSSKLKLANKKLINTTSGNETYTTQNNASSTNTFDTSVKVDVSDSNVKSQDSINGKRMPVTGTVTGTVYYQKSLKSDELIYSWRPKTEGSVDNLNMYAEENSKTVFSSPGLSLYQQVKKEVELHRRQKEDQSQNINAQNGNTVTILSTNDIKPTTVPQKIMQKPPLPNTIKIGSNQTENQPLQGVRSSSSIVIANKSPVPSTVSRLSVTSAKNELVISNNTSAADLNTNKSENKMYTDALDLGDRLPGDGEADTFEEILKTTGKNNFITKQHEQNKINLSAKRQPYTVSQSLRSTTPLPPETEEMVPENLRDTFSSDESSNDSEEHSTKTRKRSKSCTLTSSKTSKTNIDNKMAKNSERDHFKKMEESKSSSVLSRKAKEMDLKKRSRSVSNSRRLSITSDESIGKYPRRSPHNQALTPSLFPHIPPVLNFVEQGETS